MISSDDEMTDSPPTTSFRRHDWSHDQLPYFGDRRDHKMTTSSPADTDQTVLSTTTSSDLSSSTTTGGDISNSLVDHLTTIPTRMKDVEDSKKYSLLSPIGLPRSLVEHSLTKKELGHNYATSPQSVCRYTISKHMTKPQAVKKALQSVAEDSAKRESMNQSLALTLQSLTHKPSTFQQNSQANFSSSHIHVSHIFFLLEGASIILKTLKVTFSKTVSLPQGLVMFDRIAILV